MIAEDWEGIGITKAMVVWGRVVILSTTSGKIGGTVQDCQPSI